MMVLRLMPSARFLATVFTSKGAGAGYGAAAGGPDPFRLCVLRLATYGPPPRNGGNFTSTDLFDSGIDPVDGRHARSSRAIGLEQRGSHHPVRGVVQVTELIISTPFVNGATAPSKLHCVLMASQPSISSPPNVLPVKQAW